MSQKHQSTVAEVYLKSLVDNGIKHVFANAGTDFAPIIEGILAAGDDTTAAPRFVTVPHENVAIAMAHGYYLISDEPAAVMVHTTVGTANALCGLMNAARDFAPILLAAGRTPHTEDGHHGSRGGNIHWGQENFDQAGMVREYVKWDYEMRGGQSADAVVSRAVDIAMSEPRGPVYLTLPREVLGDPASEGLPTPNPRRRDPGASPPAPAADAIEQAADLLVKAEAPLILTASVGQKPQSVELLSAFTSAFAIPVVQHWSRALNMPSDHAMNFGGNIADLLAVADVVLVIDSEVPWTPARNSLRSDVTVIQMASDPLYQRIPTRGFQTDLAITAAPWMGIAALHEAMEGKMRGNKSRIDTRRRTLTEAHAEMVARRAQLLEQHRGQRPIHPALVADAINQVKSDDAIIVNELGIGPDFLNMSMQGTLIGNSPAGGLGFALGASLGAKLAAPDRDVITTVGDGSYMFGNPTPAHFVGRAEQLPTLTVVTNNQMWNAVKSSTLGMYPEGRASKANKIPLVDLQPSPDFELTMSACGGYGEKVEDPDDLIPAMERGMKAVADGQPALLNVQTRPGR